MRTRREARESRRRRSLRVRAVLAAGVVLGIGAATTLAAWNDAEYTQATFTAGKFGIVGATDGATFTEHPSGAAAALSFQLPAVAGAMAPGNTVYALFSVKTVNPSVAGVLQLTADANNTAGLGSHLRYTVRTATGPTCTAANPGTTVVVPAGSALTTAGASTQPLAANGGAQVNYCFAVTLPATADNTAQGLSTTARWTFTATSS